ncbi:dihydrofolate reductase family protein [Bradyrhizobium prioriisuperbiae]|uniref:dihydrofolate reductase family protein n=1 Tax=Bradyrhizobium prioriisuperbiae TaxID=2854389 RepID=UPI0028EBFD24|nr:dihydrofolate reductase family protein [Bradyrhizobium prioritasuperba]
MKLVLMQFLTLDGVSQGPGAPDEDTTDGFIRGGWFVPYLEEGFMETVATWVGQADGFLFGRRTYVNFARDWPKMNDPNDPIGSKMNGLPKYVASNSLKEASWSPSTILSGDVGAEIAELKAKPGRELQIHGSARLAHSLLTKELIDEFRLVIAPVVLGQGRKLFIDGGAPAGFKLANVERTVGGLAIHTYEKAGPPTFATYGAS